MSDATLVDVVGMVRCVAWNAGWLGLPMEDHFTDGLTDQLLLELIVVELGQVDEHIRRQGAAGHRLPVDDGGVDPYPEAL
jgi:hypothetical protein